MKGVIKTLEAALAVIIVLIAVIFVFTPQPKSEPQISNIGYECLNYLDNKGVLRYYAVNNLESDLKSDLKTCLFPMFNYTARVCTTAYCSVQIPENKTVYLSSYLIAGDDTMKPTLINLWIWSS